MNDKIEKIQQEIKDFEKQQRFFTTKIKQAKQEITKLRKEERASLGLSDDKIRWRTIAFQDRIIYKLWTWASPYSRKNITLQQVENYVRRLPGKHNKKNIEKSIVAIENLKKLDDKTAKYLARAFLNSCRNR